VQKVFNFEWVLCVENSNKLPKNGFQRENELNAFTLGANNTFYLIYPQRKVVCFVLSEWYLPNHDLGYAMELIIKKFKMNKGASTWCRMFGATVWNLLIIEPFFHWIFWKTKIENYIRIWGHSWYCWKAFTKFDLIKLIL